MPKFADLHAEEAELTRRLKLGKNVEGRLGEVRRQLAAHHDRHFRIDMGDEAVSRRLGLPYIGPVRPGEGIDEDTGR